MSLLGRLRTWLAPSEPAPPAGPSADEEAPGSAQPAPTNPMLDPLARVGLEGGPTEDQAIALLDRARGTSEEGSAVALALSAGRARAIPERVRVVCAELLSARGDETGALRALDGVIATPSLVLLADLQASTGALPRALGTIERVLARDIDAPGARERHTRWAASLGYGAPKRAANADVTRVGAEPAQTGLRIVREVARGGSAVVYEAEEEALGRRVAFKVYHGKNADRALVEREARVAIALGGPGIVRVLDANPQEGWIALEWIGHGSLRDALRVPESLVPIARWARPIAASLARIHAAGFVHADVKPSNVLLRSPDDPVLADFGVARRIGTANEGGSPGYLSPERLGGRVADPRDDVYAFGRIVEDALVHVRLQSDGWRDLVVRCLGPDAGRPADGAALVAALPR